MEKLGVNERLSHRRRLVANPPVPEPPAIEPPANKPPTNDHLSDKSESITVSYTSEL
jgi:hypothetical protein